MRDRLATWWRTRTDIQTLRGLDDRMLEDMGIERGDIRRRVLGPPEAPAAPRPARRAGWAEDAC